MEINSANHCQNLCESPVEADSTDYLKEPLHSILEAALDLPMQVSPALCVSIKGGAVADAELVSRVNHLSSLVLNTKPIDVYTADVEEPLISVGPFNERDSLICRGDESDFTLKRSLFALKSLEGPLQSIAYATSLLVGGVFLIHSGFIFGIAVGLGSFWCAHAYSHDAAYLDCFPEDKNELIADLQKRNISHQNKPKTFGELVQNTANYILFEVPSAIKLDVLVSYEPEGSSIQEIEIDPPVEEKEPVPETPPLPTPKELPRRGRGGARG